MSGLHDTAPQPITEFEAPARPQSLPRNGWYAPFSFEIGNGIARYVPRPLSRGFAVSMGHLGYQFCRQRRQALMSTLAVLTNDQATQKRLCRACFVNFLGMLHDFCASAAGAVPRLEKLIVERRGFEFLEAGRKRGKGTLLLTGHLGAWELGGMALAAEGLPVSVVTLEEPTPELDVWRQKYRAKFGIKTITVGSDKFAFLEIMQALRRNELVAMLVDRPYLNSGVEVKFFDQPTLFSRQSSANFQTNGLILYRSGTVKNIPMIRFLLILISFVVTSLASAAPMTSDEINDLVKKLESHYENRTSLQANFREERHMSILKEALINQGKLWFTPPDKFRREIEGNQPSTTVIDGKQMTIYYPNLKTAERYNLDKRPALKNSIQAIQAGLNFQRLAGYYNIEGTKEGKNYHVTLTPKTASIRKMVKTVTITVQQDLTPEAVDLETARGEKVNITYSNVKRDTVSDSTYQFNPPAGTNITTPFGS